MLAAVKLFKTILSYCCMAYFSAAAAQGRNPMELIVNRKSASPKCPCIYQPISCPCCPQPHLIIWLYSFLAHFSAAAAQGRNPMELIVNRKLASVVGMFCGYHAQVQVKDVSLKISHHMLIKKIYVSMSILFWNTGGQPYMPI